MTINPSELSWIKTYSNSTLAQARAFRLLIQAWLGNTFGYLCMARACALELVLVLVLEPSSSEGLISFLYILANCVQKGNIFKITKIISYFPLKYKNQFVENQHGYLLH